MGGSNSGSSSQHNTSNSTGTNSSSVATVGRERAIEALIDREPQGDYYRAARVIVRCCVCQLSNEFSILFLRLFAYAHASICYFTGTFLNLRMKLFQLLMRVDLI